MTLRSCLAWRSRCRRSFGCDCFARCVRFRLEPAEPDGSLQIGLLSPDPFGGGGQIWIVVLWLVRQVESFVEAGDEASVPAAEPHANALEVRLPVIAVAALSQMRKDLLPAFRVRWTDSMFTEEAQNSVFRSVRIQVWQEIVNSVQDSAKARSGGGLFSDRGL